MKLSKPNLVKDNHLVKYEVIVESKHGLQKLWYSLDEKYSNLLCDSNDAALVGLLIPAMESGEDIHIDGYISEKLHYHISGPLQKLIKVVIPSLHEIKIYPSSVQNKKTSDLEGVAAGFSGGIDSFMTLYNHYYSPFSKRFKLSHLIYNNVGAHGQGQEKKFQQKYEKLLSTANKIGLPFIAINSNLDDFYSKKLGFAQTHTLRNTSVALLLQGGIQLYLYSSGFYYNDTYIRESKDIAHCDLITLPMLSTEGLEIYSSGSEFTRIQKTLYVSGIPESYTSLDVCIDDKHNSSQINCSKCSKCLRTLVTLEILGLLERYTESFDLSIYQRNRTRYFTQLLESNEIRLKEIIQLAKERKFTIPLIARILNNSGIYPFFMSIKRSYRQVRQLKNRLLK